MGLSLYPCSFQGIKTWVLYLLGFPPKLSEVSIFLLYLPQCFPPARGQGKCPFLCAVYQLLTLLLFSGNYDSFALQTTMIISFLAGLRWVVVGRDGWVEVKLNLASHITSFQSLFIDTVYAPFHHVFIDNF